MEFRIESITNVTQNHINKILSILRFVRKDYPDFKSWFDTKVVPGLDNGTRNIFEAYAVSDDMYQLAGIMILKNDNIEKKVCTLCVFEPFQKRGLGTEFIKLAQNELKVDKPLITVSDSHKAEFEKIFFKFGFELFEEFPEYYKHGLAEFSYNGFLVDKSMEKHFYA